MRGWGRALKAAAANWYLGKDSSDLAYQLVKYRNCEGWQHHDVLNVAHVKHRTPRNRLYSRQEKFQSRERRLDL